MKTHRILLLFPYKLQRTLVIATLAHVNVLVTGRLRRYLLLHLLLLRLILGHFHLLQLHLLLCVAYATGLHHEHAGLVHEAITLTRVEADALVAGDAVDSANGLQFFEALVGLHRGYR